MATPVDALVTGFTKSPELLARSLEPLRRLKREGAIRNIHYVTWDRAELDPCLVPLGALPEIQLTRVPQPDASGNNHQRGIVYQVENLRAALEHVPDDALILKWRPDFVARYEFLQEKIAGFENWSVLPENVCLGVPMPPPLFQSKIWVPWADSNTPFFCEDAVFLGRRRNIEKLITPPCANDMAILGDAACCWYVHVLRYGKIFSSRYPLFENYFRRFGFFPMEVEHRKKLVPHLVENGFGWHLLIAHAWILHSQFHVDIGKAGDLSFYSNAVNGNADWSRPETLKVAFPYNDVAMWRGGTKAGLAAPSVSRAFGRLVDDEWQKALFTTGVADIPREVLAGIMENIARCRDGRLAGIESEFYRGAERIYRAHQSLALAG